MNDGPERTMTFWEHLAELRARLIKAVLAFAVASIVVWCFREPLLLWATAPFVEAWKEGGLPGEARLHFSAPAALFIAYLKLSMMGGLVVSLPFVLYQAWAFIAPGLYANEKRYALPFVLTSSGLFATGAFFCFKIVFPNAFRYLLSFGGVMKGTSFEVMPTVMIDEYINFSLRMLVAFGIVFELPVLVFFLSIAGIVTHRHLIKFARYFIVIAFVIGAVLTPPDPASQIFLAVPLMLLYAVSIVVAFIFGRRGRSETVES